MTKAQNHNDINHTSKSFQNCQPSKGQPPIKPSYLVFCGSNQETTVLNYFGIIKCKALVISYIAYIHPWINHPAKAELAVKIPSSPGNGSILPPPPQSFLAPRLPRLKHRTTTT
jgi:hypothetical protein